MIISSGKTDPSQEEEEDPTALCSFRPIPVKIISHSIQIINLHRVLALNTHYVLAATDTGTSLRGRDHLFILLCAQRLAQWDPDHWLRLLHAIMLQIGLDVNSS